MEYTEHKKITEYGNIKRMAIYEFIEFLESSGLELCNEEMVLDFEDLFYDMIDVDQEKLKEERRDMLKNLRNAKKE